MTNEIGNEKVAYVSPAETTWCVAIRDGTGISSGLFTVQTRNYYDTVEGAHEAAQRFVESGKADRYELNVVAKRFIELENDE